ncbi:sensor histidine kinase [Croceitalea rosinachiae]|uniref:Histidine kinase n=1 Tax=Croceitalea rosinachiae TaxID=3075596 RepID=A0ABU3A7S0_9FLAO|nr:histidine kinase [Croceitalea sp. F388]MDT0606222.1 histidine kinase [Croceitalea sp. F388]
MVLSTEIELLSAVMHYWSGIARNTSLDLYLYCKAVIMWQRMQHFLETSKLKYVVFGILIFAFSASTSSWYYATTKELIITYSIRAILQIAMAFVILELLVPFLLNKGKQVAFIGAIIVTLLGFYVVCTLIYMNYFEPTYPLTYANYVKRFSDASFLGRLTNINEFVFKSLYLLYPTILLSVLKLYVEKQRLLKLNEQKKIAELLALKNQLNPHFLFNTLNNLYALALKKSDDAPKVIQKLSEILDYILYRCNEPYVLLNKEIELIENYISLEKIRYADRVNISFSKSVTGEEKVAPLLLLTFIENAFKHGVTDEIKQARIDINIRKKGKELFFTVENTKPTSSENTIEKESIGLQNVKKQLELLYPKTYDLIIENGKNSFSANLKLAMG